MSEDKAQMWCYYWNLFAPSSAHRGVPEYEFDKIIKRRHRFDFAWPDERIAVEIDGGQWTRNGGRHAGDADREKLNIAASMRWIVFHFSPDQLTRNPESCVKMVVKTLEDMR